MQSTSDDGCSPTAYIQRWIPGPGRGTATRTQYSTVRREEAEPCCIGHQSSHYAPHTHSSTCFYRQSFNETYRLATTHTLELETDRQTDGQAGSRRGSRRAMLCTYAPSTSLEKNCCVYQLSIHSIHARTVRHWLYHRERVLIS